MTLSDREFKAECSRVNKQKSDRTQLALTRFPFFAIYILAFSFVITVFSFIAQQIVTLVKYIYK